MFTFVLILGALALFLWYVQHRQQFWQRNGVSCSRTTFLVGSFTDNWTGKLNMIDVCHAIYGQFRKSERVVGIYQFLTPQLLITDPALVKEVCVKHFRNFHDTSFGRMLDPENDPLLARNPFFLSGEAWKVKRAEITPAFSANRIKVMFPLVESIGDRIVEYLEGKSGEPVEARDLCSRFTCDVVSNCIFGADAQSFVHEVPEIRDMARQIFQGSFWAQVNFMLAFLSPKLASLLKFRFVSEKVQTYFSDLMGKAVEQRRRLGVEQQDYLGYLLQVQGKKQSSDLELAANAITFFLDGLDTSSVAIACALYEIARHKEVQERLRRELKGVQGHDQLVDLEYLDLVLHESLRLHPPGGLVARECTEVFDLDLGKDHSVRLNKGDSLFIPIYSIQRDPEIYEDPEEFRPERLANGELKRLSDEGLYLPFGTGPRTCIGQRFARAQSKACIAALVRNFEIDVDAKTEEPIRLDPREFFTYYKGGLWLKFRRISSTS